VKNMRNSVLKTIRFAVAALAATALGQAFADGPADRAAAVRDPWTAADINVLNTLRLSQLPATPQDPSNAFEGSPAAAQLGQRLFNDTRFSGNQAVSCATCHDPNKQFQDGLPLGRGVGTGSRRAMPIVGSGHSPWLFWDGRKDSLWSQALGPLEDAAEHGGNRVRYAHLMQSHYRADYEATFATLPDMRSLPADASPVGTPTEKAAWAAMDGPAQDGVNRVFANMGKAIAAYEKTLSHGASRFDRYVEGTLRRDPTAQQAMTPQEVDGLRIFIGNGQCVSCHNGPLFSDQQFHNTAVPPRNTASPDRGRAAAISKVQNDEFNCLGRFSDAKPAQCQELRFMVTGGRELEGAFKTPSLRGVALRPPYMHAGQFASLEAVIAHYIQAPNAVVGHTELSHGEPGHSARAPIRLTESEIKDLAAFLGSLSGPIVEAPRK
jgi:cytochrome c peroxidase